MKERMKLDRVNENKITIDWHNEIPSLGIYKRRWLLRRVGPLLIGISLERDSAGDCYLPTFHVHCLGKQLGFLTLTLATQLRSTYSGGPTSIQVRFHEHQYKQAAANIINQSLLPLSGNLILEQVLSAYKMKRQDPCTLDNHVHLFRDTIAMAMWCRDLKRASELLNECMTIPDGVLYRHVNGKRQFESDMLKFIENPQIVHDNVASEITIYHLEKLPVSELLA